MLIHTPRLRLLTMELEHLEAIVRNPLSLGEVIGAAIPDGWPAYPDAYPHALAILKEQPLRASSGWWLYLFLHPLRRALVGCGGFRDEPDSEGVVEIGCEIAPEYQRQGFALEAMRGLINYACTRPSVRALDAFSRAEECEQTGLFNALGMSRLGEEIDADSKSVWHWRITAKEFVHQRRDGME